MRRIAGGTLAWLVLIVTLVSAEHRGVLRGQLIGGDGKPMAGASVLVVSEDTGMTRRAGSSDAEGRFVVAELDAGSYRVSIDDGRFKAYAARVEVRSDATTSVILRPAEPATSVSVDHRPYFQFIDRESASFRTRFDAPFITALPLDGRNISDLVALTPGLTTTFFGPAMAGSLPTSTAYLVDGVAGFDPLFGTLSAALLPESVREFSVLTPPLDARLGRSAGAQVNIVTKSGTNTLAGSAFGFYQEQAERLQIGGNVGGPIAKDRTFFFGDIGYSSLNDEDDDTSGAIQGTGRIDQILGGGRLSARYNAARNGALDRNLDLFGATWAQPLSSALVNELRIGFTRPGFGDRWAGVLPEFDATEIADVLTWSTGSHLVSAGAEWYSVRPIEALLLPDEDTASVFVEDQWRASKALTLTGGVRYDHLSASFDGDEETSSLVAPRAGVAWVPGSWENHVLRGDYGRHLQADGSALDAWTVSLQRQWGRYRTIEAGYIGSRVDDEFSGFGANPTFNGLRIQLQQRSETATSAQVGYTYGQWEIDGLQPGTRVRASADSRHKLTAAFVWRLPFGADRHWFTGGWLGAILGDMQITGIAATQTGRPRINRDLPQGPTWRNVDAAIVKTLTLGTTQSLELRAEIFNLTNRENPNPPLLGTGFDQLVDQSLRSRRYQFGGRFRF